MSTCYDDTICQGMWGHINLIQTVDTKKPYWHRDTATQNPTLTQAKGKNINFFWIIQEVGNYYTLSLGNPLLEMLQM